MILLVFMCAVGMRGFIIMKSESSSHDPSSSITQNNGTLKQKLYSSRMFPAAVYSKITYVHLKKKNDGARVLLGSGGFEMSINGMCGLESPCYNVTAQNSTLWPWRPGLESQQRHGGESTPEQLVLRNNFEGFGSNNLDTPTVSFCEALTVRQRVAPQMEL